MKEFKKEFKKIIESTILRKYRHRISNIRHYHRKGNIGSLILTDIAHEDYIEEFGVNWGLGSGNHIGCRVYPNKRQAWLRIEIGAKYRRNLLFDYKDTINEVMDNKKLIINTIKSVENEYLYHSNFE